MYPFFCSNILVRCHGKVNNKIKLKPRISIGEKKFFTKIKNETKL